MRSGNSEPELSFRSALLCLVMVVTTPSQAVLSDLGNLPAFDRVLRVASNDTDAAAQKEWPSKDPPSRLTPAASQKQTEGTITLRGQVRLKAILKMGRAARSSDLTVAQSSTKSLNCKRPDRDRWLAATYVSHIRQPASSIGSAELQNAAITIEGVTKARDDFAAVQRKLRGRGSEGVALACRSRAARRATVRSGPLNCGKANLDFDCHAPDQQDQILWRLCSVSFP